MRNLPWPEMQSADAAPKTIRELLDYLVWIAKEMRQLGFHSGSDRDTWCRRCQRAYVALFVPMVPGAGDQYPPDVPPARNPGIWPDIPSATIPGMTLRHQLTVTEMLARQLRKRRWPHARPEEIAEWDRRLALACEALDHGAAAPMPDAARSETSQEAIDEADATEKALKAKARRRSRQLKEQFTRSRDTRKAAKKKAAPKKTAKKKAAVKKAAKKKTAKKKAAPKKTARKTAKKTTAKKQAAPKKKTAKRK